MSEASEAPMSAPAPLANDVEGAGEAEQRLRRALERALASSSPIVRRLGHARTSVAFHVGGTHEPVTLLLDRLPPRVAPAREPAEIEIVLQPAQADRFAEGRLPLPGAILSQEVRVRGPVRKYLEVDPMLRGLLWALSGAASAANGEHAVSGSTTAEPLDPKLFDAELLAIETRDLHKSFGRHQVLTGVNLRVPEGCVSVVLGPSGTGKSVLLQHVSGLTQPDRGEVIVRGQSLRRASRSQLLALRAEMGVMFQDGALFSAMTVYDNVAFPLRQHTNLREQQIREIVMERLASVGLADAARRMPNELSGGMRKRAGLARALALDPGMLLCDEPDSGLDPVRTAMLGELLLDQHSQRGGTILVITHNVSLARRISDHIAILWRGKVLEAGMTNEILGSNTEFVRQFMAGETVGPLGMD